MLRYGDTEKELSGGELETTNNRMEMMAAIKALESLKRPVQVQLYTDSVYVRDGITKWIQGWKARGWMKAGKPAKPVLNVMLWKELDALVSQLDLTCTWVRGHTGHVENERCDALVKDGIRSIGGTVE